MNFKISTVAAAVLLNTSLASAAQTNYSAVQCETWFSSIDRNKDGSIGPNENAAGFYDRITLGGASNDSSDAFIMSKSFFLAECAIGSLGKPTA